MTNPRDFCSKETCLLTRNVSSAGLDEAQRSIQSLSQIVRDVLAHNQEICRRLERSNLSTQLKHQSAPSALETLKSLSCTDDDSSTLKPKRISCSHSELSMNAEANSDYTFSFEQDLRQSRVYTRVSRIITRRSDPEPLLLPSSASCLTGSSFFSGLSLADISNLSLISLPIAASYLSNAQRYREPLTEHTISDHLPCQSHPVTRSSGRILLLGMLNRLLRAHGSSCEMLISHDIRCL